MIRVASLPSKTRDEDDNGVQFNAVHINSGVDVAASLVVGHAEDAQLSGEESRRLRNKLDKRLLPLLFAVYMLQYLDKAALGSAAILGIIQDTNLTTNEFNTLGSVYYIGILMFQWPQAWALQRLPVAKWLSFNLFVWAVLLGLHPVCKNFGGLMTLRLLLGAAEAPTIPAVMILTGMFYRRTEIGERMGWILQCNGFATMLTGLLAFGAIHLSPDGHPRQWQWFMIINALITLVVCILFLAFFPDNPTTARFLTTAEKIHVVNRIQANQTGIETKKWKTKQFIEALRDVKTWLFFLFAAIFNLQNGFNIEYSFLLKGLGFTPLQTTLLNIPTGAAQVVSIPLAGLMLRRFPNSRAWIAILFLLPSILAAVLLMRLPSGSKVGLLTAIYIFGFGAAPSFVMAMSWVVSTSAGHTKKVTINGIFVAGYALGQVLCTQFWKDKYAPRYQVPWGICLASYVADIALLLTIRYVLSTENRRRDALAERSQLVPGDGKTPESASNGDAGDQHEFGWLETSDEAGRNVNVKVHKALLDLTDRENLAFRYVL